MTGAPPGDDELWSAAERARLAALAAEVERVRAAAGAAAPDGPHGLTPVERPLDWTLLGQVATEVARLLWQAGVLGQDDARYLAARLARPPTVAALTAWGTGRRQSAPFARAELAWAVVRLALPPFLRVPGAARVTHASESGSCPECGGAPELAILEPGPGARLLICGTCEARWRFDRVRCPFCGNAAHAELAYLAGGPRGLLVRVCDACGSYLKTVDRRQRPGDESPLLPRMLTVEMDLAAQAAGYRAYRPR